LPVEMVSWMWSFQHSVECPVNRELAWKFWSNVDNWARVDPAVEWSTLDGPFSAGTRGTTKPRGSEPNHWLITDVVDGTSATIEISIPRALVRFRWLLEDTENDTSRLTQTASLEGERAAEYEAAVKDLEAGIPAGMLKLVDGIVGSIQ